MQPVKFGAYLRQLLARKKTSASELARMMGFKSRNTIFRILDEECSHTSRQAFYDRLIEMDVLSLDGVQREELAAALEVSRVGSDVYLDNLAMAQLLGKQREGGGDEIIILSGAETEKKLTLMELLCQYTEGRKLELIISGCCRKNLFDTLRRALLCREHGCRVTVTHYLYMGADEIIANIAAIQPMLYSPCYMPYGIEPGEHSPERERMYRSNCICARVTPEDGRAYDEVLVLSDRDRMIRFERRARGGFMTADSVLGDRRLKDHPIKSSFEMEDPSRKLIAYVEECRRMERNHAVYNVRLDMPISLIHPDMLLRAVMDSGEGDSERRSTWKRSSASCTTCTLTGGTTTLPNAGRRTWSFPAERWRNLRGRADRRIIFSRCGRLRRGNAERFWSISAFRRSTILISASIFSGTMQGRRIWKSGCMRAWAC